MSPHPPQPHPPMPPMPPVTAPPGTMPPMPPVPADAQKLHQITGNDACIKRLQQLKVENGAKMYMKPAEPGQLGRKVDIQTNIFGVKVTKETTVHRFMVHAKANLTPTN